MGLVRSAFAAALVGVVGCSAQVTTSSEGSNGPANPSCVDCALGAAGSSADSDAGAPKTQQLSSCAPGDTSRYSLAWTPPAPTHQGKCTSAQIDSFYASCLGPKADANQCAAFTDPAGPLNDCGACIVTQSTAADAGPVVDDGYSRVVNVGGCIASFSGGLECGKAWQRKLDCGEFACRANCQQAPSEYDACVKAAMKTTCKSYAETWAACAATLPTEALRCLDSATGLAVDQQQFTEIATLFCGPR